jgi:V/A-type H+-transporting ATPase subunit K
MNPTKEFKKKVGFTLLFVIVVCILFAFSGVSNVFAQDHQEQQVITVEQKAASGNATSIGLIAAAIAFGFGAIGAGVAIGNVGSAAMGAIAEKPELASQALIFIALAEGLVVFGFITALMILGKIG